MFALLGKNTFPPSVPRLATSLPRCQQSSIIHAYFFFFREVVSKPDSMSGNITCIMLKTYL